MALVITVILLAVVTIMAITFLAVSRRERSSVTTTTDSTTAQLAADNALAAAEAQVIGSALATTNPYNFSLLVSTNFINAAGFTPGNDSPTNVNYDYLSGPGTYTVDDFLQNLANLSYLPRPPVYATNYFARNTELQFYLDLNRNGRDDTNGLVGNFDNNGNLLGTISEIGDPEWVGVLQHPDQPYGPNNPFVARYAFVAVPIGNALDLNAIHNDSMGPKAKMSMASGYDGFLRNQGAGSWEINLAAFLADLNTNSWDNFIGGVYDYREPIDLQDTGAAFDDAQALLRYRYANTFISLNAVGGVGGLFTAATFFPPFQNNIDYYSQGPLMTGPGGVNVGAQNVQSVWSGSDNPNHFFDLQELYNTGSPVFGSFAGRLASASQGPSTYNRYTYYRLLSQMGVDSAPAQNQINLNYSNAVAYYARDQFNRIIPGVVTNIVFFPNAETNFAPWEPAQFFLIAADKMLRAYSQEWMSENASNYMVTYGSFANIGTTFNPTNVPVPFGVSDIPVLVSNRFVYTPAVQRVLQLAANMYDATTNNYAVNGNSHDFPSVFRPIFLVTNDSASGFTNVYIRGFEPVGQVVNGVEQVGLVQGTNDFQLNSPVEVTSLSAGSATLGAWEMYTNVNVYGVPWIIGAKKGLPNFNEFSMLTLVGVTRKLEVTRPSLNATLDQYQTNQMYIFSISNSLGVECWNSYASNYYPSSASGLTILARDNFSITLSNRDRLTTPQFVGYFTPTNNFPASIYSFGNSVFMNGATVSWPGSSPWTTTTGTRLSPNRGSFDIPLSANVAVLTNSIYVDQVDNPAFTLPATADTFIPAAQNITENYDYPALGTPPLPQFDLVITNRLQVFMLDGNHVIDYVQLGGPDTVTNLNRILADVPSAVNRESPDDGLWNTNSLTGFTNGTPYGVVNQVLYSLNPQVYGPGGMENRLVNNDDHTWRNPPGGGTVGDAIAAFNAFFSPSHVGSGTDPNTGKTYTDTNFSDSVQVPFTPTRYIYGYTSWQANDPLVHYMVSDLNFSGSEPGGLQTGWHQWENAWGSNAPPTNLGRLNDRYAPWGWDDTASAPPGITVDVYSYNSRVRDPLVRSSDNWDFPSYKLPTAGWLGRVHRGTPWQTVYLKSLDVLRETARSGSVTNDIGTNTWAAWTGDTRLTYGQNYDAVNSAPVQDRLLFDLFSTAPNDNATRGQLSVNVDANRPNDPQAGLAAWSAVFSGVQALSNNLPTTFQFRVQPRSQNPLAGELPPAFINTVIDPAGTPGANSPLGRLVAGINQTRANFVNVDGVKGAFGHAGDILAVPQLSDQSPFLNSSDIEQQKNGISDEMYEWLPQQVMSLLRASGTPQSPMRYIIYSYGQALKPAPDGLYTDSTALANGQSAFGMVTNYQVVAEYATRSVVSFNSVVTNVVPILYEDGNQIYSSLPVVTNNTAQILQFNVLPPY